MILQVEGWRKYGLCNESISYAFRKWKTEWCVEYPDLKGCVGGGDTIEEAIADAEASKSVYLSYLEKTKNNALTHEHCSS